MTLFGPTAEATVAAIEARYRVVLNARGDTKLKNLLRIRGFSSQTQLLTAYRGNATSHARRRRVFLSFHAEDLRQVEAFRLMIRNPNLELTLYDQGLGQPINSERGTYVRSRIKPLIAQSEVLLCLLGNGTAWRDWVDWEILTAKEMRKGICAVRLRDSRAQVPARLVEHGIPVARWGVAQAIAAIEQAAARRS